MNRAKIFIAFTIVLALALQVSAQENKSVKSLNLSVSDQTEIINQIFDDGFEKLMGNSENSPIKTCLTPLVSNEKVIFISTEIEKGSVKPEIKGYRFRFMASAQMEKRFQKGKGECYFRITRFIVSNSKVKISLSRFYHIPDYIHAIGFQYEFEKMDGKWRKKLLRNQRIDS